MAKANILVDLSQYILYHPSLSLTILNSKNAMKVYLPPHEISLEIRIEIQNFPPISQTVDRIQKIRKSWKGREQRDGKMDTREENEREENFGKIFLKKDTKRTR